MENSDRLRKWTETSGTLCELSSTGLIVETETHFDDILVNIIRYEQ